MTPPRFYPGWVGLHTRDEVLGAWRNGTRVIKVKTEPGDAHPLGSMATVLGSMQAPDPDRTLGYFVEWDAKPRCAVFVMAAKITASLMTD